MAKYDVKGGYVEIPDDPTPPPNGGSNMSVDEGAGKASVSYPWLDSFVGYGCLYQDHPDYFRTINAGFNAVLNIDPSAWPPGYRIANGQKGGGYPPSGSKPSGSEPIRLCPPPKGQGRLSFFTFCKLVITNPTNTKGAFAAGLGVVYVNGPNRPMFPYLGAAHDLDINAFRPETIGPGDTRSVSMFRTDFIDIAMDGGASTFPDWPNWEMKVSTQSQAYAQNMYPAVGISFKNTGSVALQVGNVFAYGWVS